MLYKGSSLQVGFMKSRYWPGLVVLSTYNVCDLVRKFIHSICCKMYMYEFHFTEIGNGKTVNYISCVSIGYKNVFGPIAVLVTNRFRLEQKGYLPLKLQFMSGFGKTTIFNGLLGNRRDVFCWASDVIYCFPQLFIFIEPINTRFHVIHKYSLNIRKETCFFCFFMTWINFQTVEDTRSQTL
jgi:hypothetical protein